MSRTVTEIRSIARSHTRTAINTLVGVMTAKDATPAAREALAEKFPDPVARHMANGTRGSRRI